MRRNYWISLIGTIVLAVASVTYVVVKGYTPKLGLDLQGGASITLQPKGKADAATLDQAKEIIRSRVDAFGVGETDVRLEGDSIVVALPGFTDERRAEQLVGKTAKLTFRKVLEQVEPDPTNTTTSSVPPPKAGETTTTTTPPQAPAVKTTPRSESAANKEIVLPADPTSPTGTRLRLDKPVLSGDDLKAGAARVEIDTSTGERVVSLEFKGGKATDTWKSFTAANVNQQMAIVLDGEIKSAPTIQVAFTDGKVQISGGVGGFKSKEASDLVSVLKYGALPVELQTESVQKVSATLGLDSLRAGLIAGLIGLALVMIYILLYYRALGLVALVGLIISAAYLYFIICFLGHTQGLALTLSGVTGIVVSIGVTVDSYVVYFEKLKDEVRAGRTIRSSIDRGFSSAFRTILAANATSLIGAAILYFLSIGPVRGFAFFLGVSTLLDIIIAWFFTRPAVALLARNHFFTDMRFFGVARGLVAPSEASR